jgi:hypothetical protein
MLAWQKKAQLVYLLFCYAVAHRYINSEPHASARQARRKEGKDKPQCIAMYSAEYSAAAWPWSQ